jgi:hypothetical protein
MQMQRRMRGFFASLRMTSIFWSGLGSRTGKGSGKARSVGRRSSGAGEANAKSNANAKANAGVLRYAQNDKQLGQLRFVKWDSFVETSLPILREGASHGRGVEIFLECDAGEQVAAVAERLSAMAAGDLFRPEGGYGAGARLLESFLDGKETVHPVSSMDA